MDMKQTRFSTYLNNKHVWLGDKTLLGSCLKLILYFLGKELSISDGILVINSQKKAHVFD